MTTGKHRHSDADDNDEESRMYKVYSHAAAEVWRDTVIKADNADEAKKAYRMLYDMLHSQVLPKQPNFVVSNKQKVLDIVLDLVF